MKAINITFYGMPVSSIA